MILMPSELPLILLLDDRKYIFGINSNVPRNPPTDSIMLLSFLKFSIFPLY